MSRRTDGSLPGAEHARARELAAARLDESLPPAEAAWLEAHLATCEACCAVAAGYDHGRSVLRALRDTSPEPPRDLWARTSAALETERARGTRRPGRFGRVGRPGRWNRIGRVAAAPLVGLVVVALVVGSGLLGGAAGPVGPGSMATPIALAAAADLRVLTRSSDGTVSLVSGEMKSVCPIGSESCGVAPSFAVTPVAGITTTSVLAVVSPSQDRAVVTDRTGVFILPMTPPQLIASTAPTSRPTPAHSPSAAPSPSPSAASTPTHASGTATPTTPATVAPTATPAATPAGSPATTSTTPAATSPAPIEASAAPSASPSIAVSPVPGGAIQIASDVTVVGAVVYSPDGRQVAFAARPSDGSAGPDIFVWTAGDATAHALTTDHATQLAGWTAAGILAGRVLGGMPSTDLLDPATGKATPLQGQAWMPVVNVAGTAAAWWDGTLKLAADGITWVPDAGRLLLGAWPPAPAPSASAAPSDPTSPGVSAAAAATASASPAATPAPGSGLPGAAGIAPSDGAGSPSAAPFAGAGAQVIADGPVDGWEVRWDEGGTVLAVWLHEGTADKQGRLSLYSIDPVTGLAGLAHPLLDSAPAAEGISLRSGRLVWSGPGTSGHDAVQVLAWNGTEVGRLELPAGQGATVVP